MPWFTGIRKLKEISCPDCGAAVVAARSDARCKSCKAESRRDVNKRCMGTEASKARVKEYDSRPDVRLKKAGHSATYRAKNPEKVKAALNAWREKNKDKTAANKRAFQERSRAHRCAYQRMREAAKTRQMPAWANADHIKGIYEVCGLFRSIGLDLHVDHIIPLKGKDAMGLHVENNLRIIPAIDNLKKKNRLEETSAVV